MAGGVHLGNVDDVFSYHAPSEVQKVQYEAIRSAAGELARVILRATPACADQQAALRKLRECVMTANASVALQGIV